MVLVDLALNTFDADVVALVDIARRAEAAGVGGVWVPDHFSGAVVGRRWSRDPFVCLGAVAQATDRVRIGPLVANVRNRHPAQLASAANSLSSLAPGRVVLGIGSGAAPGSRFAVEHEAIGTELGDASFRRSLLIDHIAEVRRLHRGSDDDRLAVTDGSPCPPIVVGASARRTVELAVDHADGLNLRAGPAAVELVTEVRRRAAPTFEISVLTWIDASADEIDALADAGVDRVVLGISAEHTWGDVAAAIDRASTG